MHWDVSDGTVDQYLVRAGVTDYEEKLKALRYVLAGNIDINLPKCQQIYPFLELFVPGEYSIWYEESWSHSGDCLRFDTTWDFAKEYDEHYPHGNTTAWIYTQPTDSLKAERIDHYVKLIESGDKPIILMAGNLGEDNYKFVLDGHHKLEAYREARINPAVIFINRWDAPSLQQSDFEKYFDKKHPLAEHYSIVASADWTVQDVGKRIWEAQRSLKK
jgi:hypothetical protein